MTVSVTEYQPVEGKTFSLFGSSSSTEGYYRNIRILADTILESESIDSVLRAIHKHSWRRSYLRRIARGKKQSTVIEKCLTLLTPVMRQYTINSANHLKGLSLSKIWDRRLATTEEQYHLYMLEIELTNRLNRDAYLSSSRKISLQPYCLQDFSAECRAEKKGLDYQCRFCSTVCFQSMASKILRKHGIEPYIWMGAGLKEFAGEAKQKGQNIGILGIACIPELVSGMRKCIKYGIPVVGLPLNANRCIRWYGEFRQNSVDIAELEKLVMKPGYS